MRDAFKFTQEVPGGSWLLALPRGEGALDGCWTGIHIQEETEGGRERRERAAPFAGAGAGCLQHKYMQMYSASLALPGMGRYKQSQEEHSSQAPGCCL